MWYKIAVALKTRWSKIMIYRQHIKLSWHIRKGLPVKITPFRAFVCLKNYLKLQIYRWRSYHTAPLSVWRVTSSYRSACPMERSIWNMTSFAWFKLTTLVLLEVRISWITLVTAERASSAFTKCFGTTRLSTERCAHKLLDTFLIVRFLPKQETRMKNTCL